MDEISPSGNAFGPYRQQISLRPLLGQQNPFGFFPPLHRNQSVLFLLVVIEFSIAKDVTSYPLSESAACDASMLPECAVIARLVSFE